jgi:hypothetical protein
MAAATLAVPSYNERWWWWVVATSLVVEVLAGLPVLSAAAGALEDLLELDLVQGGAEVGGGLLVVLLGEPVREVHQVLRELNGL